MPNYYNKNRNKNRLMYAGHSVGIKPCVRAFAALSRQTKAVRCHTAALGILLLSIFLSGCASINYLSGLYEQNPDQQADVVVRVKDHKGLALTDLALNDFYVKHNGKPLERKNELRLNETLSAVKLYMVVLIDQRQNPELKNSFERMREALKAYLTLQPQNMYIKLISYDSQARALNDEFSNDKAELQELLQDLQEVQEKESALEQALGLAQDSIEALPHGAYALEPELFPATQMRAVAESPLYDSAILMMNHNSLDLASLNPYADKYNFVVLDATRELPPLRSAQEDSYDQNGFSTIFDVYELPPGYLNKDVDQTRAVRLINQAWDRLNDIVNGYYWLSYRKYTDLGRQEPNLVTVSLTQYGRAKDFGSLVAYTDRTEGLTPKVSGDGVLTDMPELADIDEDDELQPPGISAPVSISYPDLMGLAPGQHPDTLPTASLTDTALTTKPGYPVGPQVVTEELPAAPAIDDFEILGNLNKPKAGNYLVRNEEAKVPQFTAKPIPLVSTQPSYELLSEPGATSQSVPKLLPTDPEELNKELTNGRYIQVGAFVELDNLYDVMERLSSDYNVRAVTSIVNGKEYNRCIIGPFDSVAETQDALQHLRSLSGLRDAFIIKGTIAEWIGD